MLSVVSRLKVGQRLTIGGGLLCLLAAALAGIGYQEIRNLRARLEAVPQAMTTRVELAEWQGNTAANAGRVVAVLRASDADLAARRSARQPHAGQPPDKY